MIATAIDIAWDEGLPIFASESFLRGTGDDYGWLGGISDTGELRCILPYTVIRKAGFKLVRFRVETISVGKHFDVAEERRFLNAVIAHFRRHGMDMVVPATNTAVFRTYPEGALAVPYGSYVVDLDQTEDELLANLHRKHRNSIRGAEKHGVLIRSGPDFLEAAHRMIQQTLRRSGLGFMNFAKLGRYVSSLGGNVLIMIAEHHGKLQGAAVIPYSRHAAYYVYGGSEPHPINGATTLLHWEAMLRCRRMGIRAYDFVGTRIGPPAGSKQAGLASFKERFGGTLVPGYMWKYPLKPLRFALYSLAMRLLHGGDVVDQERSKLVDSHRITGTGSPIDEHADLAP